MKVIFVASGNKTGGKVSAFVQSQYDSLVKEGLDMVLFPVQGKGALNYLKAVFELRKTVKREKPDIIHAHYSTCGFVASLACMGMRHRPKIVVSILGSFPTRSTKWRRVRWAIRHLWDGALTKSERTRKQLGLDLPVIPNGVNLEVFHPMDYEEARRMVGFERVRELESERVRERKYVIWCSHPSRPEKKWGVAVQAIKELGSEGFRELESEGIRELGTIELVAVYDKTPAEVALYMTAADCLLLTSESEGSPNVIKEALACNCPIVTTDVGDVNERLTGLEGCYVVKELGSERIRELENEGIRELESERVSELGKAIIKALQFGKRTKGYERILADGLEISQVAQRIIEIYQHL